MRNSLAIVGQPMDENPKELLGGMSTGSTKLIIFPSSTRANKFRGIATTGQTRDAAQTGKKKRTEVNKIVLRLSDETKTSKEFLQHQENENVQSTSCERLILEVWEQLTSQQFFCKQNNMPDRADYNNCRYGTAWHIVAATCQRAAAG
jgi:hypothetical protein